MWLAIGSRLLGIGKRIVGWITDFIEWLFEDWRRVAAAIAIAVFLFMAWEIRSLNGDLKDQVALTTKEKTRADNAEHDFGLLKDQHYNFVADVQAKQQEAERLDQANVARVARRMEQIKERTAHEYEARLVDTLGALDRLRKRIAAGTTAESGSHSKAADMPDDYAARCKAFGYANCDALLTALPDLLAAAEDNTAKLIALQQWARGVLAVDLTGEPYPAN